MTDISINAGLTASLIPQAPVVNQTFAESEPAQSISFYDALQSTPSIKSADVSRPAANPQGQTEQFAASAEVSSAAAPQGGYVQKPAEYTDSDSHIEEGYTQTAPAYDYSKTEGIAVSPETIEELAGLLAEKADIPSPYEQAKQALESAMLKAIQDLNNPELQEEKAKEKLLLALMKFLEKLNGEPEKETALDDKDEEKEFQGVLLEIVERLIESAREQQKPDDDLDGNAPMTDLLVPASETTEQVEFKKVENKPLTGINQLRSDMLLKERFPSLARVRAAEKGRPIPVPIDPRKYSVMSEGVIADKAVIEAENDAADTVQAPVLPVLDAVADNAEISPAEVQPSDNVQVLPDIPDESVPAESSNTDRNVQDIVPPQVIPETTTNVNQTAASETGIQQVQRPQNVQSVVNSPYLKDAINILDGVGPVEKVQDDKFIGTVGGTFVIEFLPTGSNELTGTVLGMDVSRQPADVLSNAPADSALTEDPSPTLPVQDAENSETDTLAPTPIPAQDTDSDNPAETVKPLETEEEVYIPADESTEPNPVKETDTKALQADKAVQLPEDEAIYEKLAESVYSEVYAALKEEEQVQPATDYASIQQNNVSDRKAVSDELDELSRLFGVKKEPEVRQLPIDDEEPDKVSEISKEVPVEEISVVSSKTPDAPQIRTFDLGEGGIKQVVTQIVTEIIHNLPQKGGETTLTMTLNPESLGRISIKLVENAGKLSVSIVAENKETAAMLASRYDSIQESLRDNGTQLEKYQVVYGAEQDSKAEQQNYEGSSKNPYVRQDEEHDEGNDGQFRELLENAV